MAILEDGVTTYGSKTTVPAWLDGDKPPVDDPKRKKKPRVVGDKWWEDDDYKTQAYYGRGSVGSSGPPVPKLPYASRSNPLGATPPSVPPPAFSLSPVGSPLLPASRSNPLGTQPSVPPPTNYASAAYYNPNGAPGSTPPAPVPTPPDPKNGSYYMRGRGPGPSVLPAPGKSSRSYQPVVFPVVGTNGVSSGSYKSAVTGVSPNSVRPVTTVPPATEPSVYGTNSFIGAGGRAVRGNMDNIYGITLADAQAGANGGAIWLDGLPPVTVPPPVTSGGGGGWGGGWGGKGNKGRYGARSANMGLYSWNFG